MGEIPRRWLSVSDIEAQLCIGQRLLEERNATAVRLQYHRDCEVSLCADERYVCIPTDGIVLDAVRGSRAFCPRRDFSRDMQLLAGRYFAKIIADAGPVRSASRTPLEKRDAVEQYQSPHMSCNSVVYVSMCQLLAHVCCYHGSDNPQFDLWPVRLMG